MVRPPWSMAPSSPCQMTLQFGAQSSFVNIKSSGLYCPADRCTVISSGSGASPASMERTNARASAAVDTLLHDTSVLPAFSQVSGVIPTQICMNFILLLLCRFFHVFPACILSHLAEKRKVYGSIFPDYFLFLPILHRKYCPHCVYFDTFLLLTRRCVL